MKFCKLYHNRWSVGNNKLLQWVWIRTTSSSIGIIINCYGIVSALVLFQIVMTSISALLWSCFWPLWYLFLDTMTLFSELSPLKIEFFTKLCPEIFKICTEKPKILFVIYILEILKMTPGNVKTKLCFVKIWNRYLGLAP